MYDDIISHRKKKLKLKYIYLININQLIKYKII